MLRRVALTAALAALLAPAGPAEAAKKKKVVKHPVVTSVTPMNAEVGDQLTIRGRYFKKGKGRNTVVFRRSGGKAVFVKADVATLTRLYVTVPEKLQGQMGAPGGKPAPTVFQVRILAARLGRSFTPVGKSPRIGPDTDSVSVTPSSPPPAAAAAAADSDCDGDGSKNKDDADDDNDTLTDVIEKSLGLDTCNADTDGDGTPDKQEVDCDGNGVLNRDQADDDSDLLDDALEAKLMTDPCKADSDGDGIEDGYEYKSAIDLNDDEYQQPNTALPYPSKRPYPNPLDSGDANHDHDGDGMYMWNEFKLWKYTYETAGTAQRTLFPLSYSAGMQFSVHEVCKAPFPAGSPCADNPNSEGRRYPTLKVENYERWFGPNGFYTWSQNSAYARIVLGWYAASPPYYPGKEYALLDANLSGVVADGGWNTTGVPNAVDSEGDEMIHSELYAFAMDGDLFLSDDERDEDADGLSNMDEIGGRMVRSYWSKCYSSEGVFPTAPGAPTHPLSAFDADSDGDGVRDGADDEDHDDIPNIMELSRIQASGYDDTEDGSIPPIVPQGMPLPEPSVGPDGPAYDACKVDKELPPYRDQGSPWHAYEYGRVNPFNPCLPSSSARTCPRYSQGDGPAYAPFDDHGNRHWWSLQ
jgi:hypothetical protein